MYTDEERKIYGPYPSGRKGELLYGDPLKIYRRLVHYLDGDPNTVLENTHDDKPEPVRFEATERVVDAVIRSFDLKPFDPATGEGATEDDCFTILDVYQEWLEGEEKAAEKTPMSQPPTDFGLTAIGPISGPGSVSG